MSAIHRAFASDLVALDHRIQLVSISIVLGVQSSVVTCLQSYGRQFSITRPVPVQIRQQEVENLEFHVRQAKGLVPICSRLCRFSIEQAATMTRRKRNRNSWRRNHPERFLGVFPLAPGDMFPLPEWISRGSRLVLSACLLVCRPACLCIYISSVCLHFRR